MALLSNHNIRQKPSNQQQHLTPIYSGLSATESLYPTYETANCDNLKIYGRDASLKREVDYYDYTRDATFDYAKVPETCGTATYGVLTPPRR